MILVTGGAGYIGSHTNKLLNKKGYETVVFDNLVYGHKEFAKWGEFVLGDLNNIEQVRLLFEKYDIEAVIHFAAFAYVGESVKKPEKYYLNNVYNTLNLLKVMREYNCKYIVFSSTCATYGVPEKIPIDENHSQNPINPYGQSKLMIEKILEDYSKAYGLKYVSLRYFNVAGADIDGEIGEWHEPETHLIPNILDVAIEKKEYVEVYGTDYPTPDGTCIRDFIHVVDLAEAHILALEYLRKNQKSDVFNLGNGNGFSVLEVIKKVEEITGKSINYKKMPRREGDPPVLVADATKARNILNWKPKYNSSDTIIETAWDWHKKLYREYKK